MFYPHSEDVMGWEITAGGFHQLEAPQVPRFELAPHLLDVEGVGECLEVHLDRRQQRQREGRVGIDRHVVEGGILDLSPGAGLGGRGPGQPSPVRRSKRLTISVQPGNRCRSLRSS